MHIYQLNFEHLKKIPSRFLIRILSLLHDCSGSAIFSALTAGPRIITTSIVACNCQDKTHNENNIKAEGLQVLAGNTVHLNWYQYRCYDNNCYYRPIASNYSHVTGYVFEDIPVNSLGVSAMIMLISVTGNSAAPIPNRNSEAVTSADVSWNIVASKKDTDIITMLGTSNFVLSLRFFANNTPKTGPNINTANDNGSL